MSRIDQHIMTVRSRLALAVFFQAWAWAALILAGVVWLVVIAEHLLDRSLSHEWALLLVCLLASAVGALIYCILRRPTPHDAAIAIDRTLGLKEKFSTALYARPLGDDPFARAAVLDAERSAQNVSLHKRFPIPLPNHALTVLAVFVCALLTAWLMPTFHLFAKPSTPPAPKPPDPALKAAEKKKLDEQLPKIEQAAQLLPQSNAIKKAQDDLRQATQTKEGDELRSKRNTLSALQETKKAMAEELDRNEKFQTALNERQTLSNLSTAQDDSTPMGKAQNQIKAGDLDAAMNSIAKAVNDFDKLKPEDQQKTAQQAQQLAQALAQAASDPHVQQKIAQQLQQMGASQQQAQQMAQTMQQAANGNKQAQQQLQQMAQQMAQQMNNGQGPTQQQQQQIQQMMSKAQSMANSQAQSAALSQAAQQLAQSMAQAQKSGQGQKSGQSQKPGQNQNPGKGQQPGQSQQQASPGQSQSNQAQQGQGQGMSQAQQNMQQQMQQMQATAKDAQAMKAGADAAAQAAADAAAGLDSNSGDSQSGQGSSDSSKNDPGPPPQGQPHQGQGGNKPGPGGAKMGIRETPYGGFKQELDNSPDNGNGKILASRYVKAGVDPGESKAGLRDAAASAEQQTPDEIEQDHVSHDAQQAVKDYFSGMQQEGQ